MSYFAGRNAPQNAPQLAEGACCQRVAVDTARSTNTLRDPSLGSSDTWVSPYWYLFTAFVGLNLLQSSITKWCLIERFLAKLGVE